MGMGVMSALSLVTIDSELLTLKDIVLRQRAHDIPLQGITDSGLYQMLALEMFEIMYASYGAALAAPQVGIPLRLVVMDPVRLDFGPHVLINPIILYKGEAEEVEVESCLSLPCCAGKIYRSVKLQVIAYNLSGEKEEYTAEGLLARIFQHEIDHLEGILYPDLLRPGDCLQRSYTYKGARRKAIEALKIQQEAII
jgi:peptide deformylase